MSTNRRAFWRFKLFQLPAMLFAACLVMLLLFSQLNLGLPKVAVAIALDVSGSTQSGDTFNASGSIMSQAINAVQFYLDKNTLLKQPNQIKIIAMGGGKAPEITKDFQGDASLVKAELDKTIKDPNFAQSIKPEPPRDNLNIVFQAANQAFSTVPGMCHELMVVSDAGVDLSDETIAEAVSNKVRVSSIIFGGNDVDQLKNAAALTKGLYLSGSAGDFTQFFVDRFFPKINSNWRWIIFWMGAVWLAFIWMMTLPIDIFFQKIMGFSMPQAGKFALLHSMFWSTLTPIIVWKLSEGLPFMNACS
jgi:Ca-activated chloride channel homolog